jgi:hypothetical protein
MPSRLFAAIVLCCALAAPARAEEVWKQTAEGVFKGHRLTTSIEETSHRGLIKLDDRQIATTDAVSEIGKIRISDAETSVLFSVYSKSAQGDCGSYTLVSVPLATGDRKNEALANFGACNSKLTITVDRRRGWGVWYAIAYRDDRATASVALIRDAALAMHEVQAPPCLFQSPLPGDCLWQIEAEASGSVERGVLTGDGAFADHRIETYLNRSSGKATLELDHRALRTFDNAKEFFLDSVNGDNEFGLFAFWLKPNGEECPTRPLVFFPQRASEPQIITDFAPCADRMLRTVRRSKASVDWLGIAYKLGDPHGFIVSVIDHRLSTRPAQLPPCLVTAEGAKSADCLRQVLAPTPRGMPPPRVAPVPPPAAPALKPKPNTIGI